MSVVPAAPTNEYRPELPPEEPFIPSCLGLGAGTLNLSSGGSGVGTWSVASSANLTFTSGSFALANGTVNGAGTVGVTGDSVEVGAGFAPTRLVSQSGGTLEGSGSLTVSGSLNWTSGTMPGTGATVVATSGTLSLSGRGSRFLASRTLRIAGAGTRTDGGLLYLADVSRLEVAAGGSLDLSANASVLY